MIKEKEILDLFISELPRSYAPVIGIIRYEKEASIARGCDRKNEKPTSVDCSNNCICEKMLAFILCFANGPHLKR